MSSDIAIRVEGLGKAYTVRHRRHDHVTLAQTALERLKHPFHRDEREEFWALRDVSFEVKQGEVLGIIGRNGAGKSTLLKLLTRITAPTTGRVDLWGRVGSLLEVGTGFHPELTGRENVYLNGSILGMTRKEIDRQFDEIVAFAGVEKFLDTPVKRYSSGMYVRLAFAVAAHLQTEILFIDEVLAVGDGDFQRKCLSKLRDVSTLGRTVLLVSHTANVITELSTRALWLEKGAVSGWGDSREIQGMYASSLPTGLRTVDTGDRLRSNSLFRCVTVEAVGVSAETSEVEYGGTLCTQFELLGHDSVQNFRVQVGIRIEGGGTIGCSFSDHCLSVSRGERLRVRAVLQDLRLAPGRYAVVASVGRGDQFSNAEEFDVILNCGSFVVLPRRRLGGAVGAQWQDNWGSIDFGVATIEVDDPQVP